MSLSVRERHALHGIEERLARSDAKLASLHGMFARLASGEEMPVRERICPGWRHALSRQPGDHHGPVRDMARRPIIRHVGWQRAMLLLWLLIALAMTATAVALSRAGGSRTCAPPWTVCATSSSAGSLRPATPAHGSSALHRPLHRAYAGDGE